MFSTHSFNALLKTLEEPPPHVKFLLATTDPQKVPVTVLSRCLQFNLKRMSTALLSDYLATLLKAESIEFDVPALELIAQAADGSVRDALSLVEQAAAFGNGAVAAADVESMLGRVSVTRLLKLLTSISKGDAETLFADVDALDEYAPDYTQLMAELLSLLHRIAMLQSGADKADGATVHAEELITLSSSLSNEDVQLYYQIGQHARRDMPFSSDHREAFDMALLRMIAFKPQQSGTAATGASTSEHTAISQSGRVSADRPSSAPSSGTIAGNRQGGKQIDGVKSAATGENRVSAASTGADPIAEKPAEPAQAGAARAKKKPVKSELAAAALAAANAPDEPKTRQNEKKNDVKPSSQAVQSEPDASTSSGSDKHANVTKARARESRSTETVSSDSGLSDSVSVEQGSPKSGTLEPEVSESIPVEQLTTEHWLDVVAQSGLSGMPRQLASHCILFERDGDVIDLQLEQQQEHLNTTQFRSRLQSALSERTRVALTVNISVVSAELQTPARINEQRRQQALSDARTAIDEDPVVKQLLSEVDGVVDESSVQPVTDSE